MCLFHRHMFHGKNWQIEQKSPFFDLDCWIPVVRSGVEEYFIWVFYVVPSRGKFPGTPHCTQVFYRILLLKLSLDSGTEKKKNKTRPWPGPLNFFLLLSIILAYLIILKNFKVITQTRSAAPHPISEIVFWLRYRFYKYTEFHHKSLFIFLNIFFFKFPLEFGIKTFGCVGNVHKKIVNIASAF